MKKVTKKNIRIKYILVLIYLFAGANISYGQSGKAVLTNFRIENNQTKRVYFDVKGNISKLTKQGFIISNNSITGLNKSGKYFTVKKGFTFWDNNTIRLEKGDGTVSDFALNFIDNRIKEPSAKSEQWYVNSKMKKSGNGKSKGAAFKTIMEGVRAVTKGGATIHVKAGNYGSETLKIWGELPSNSADKPFIIQGYKNTPGDLNGVKYYTYSKGQNLSSSKAPLLDGKNRAKGTGISFAAPGGKSRQYVIIRNIQVQNFKNGLVSNGGSRLVLENSIFRNMGKEKVDNGIHFYSGESNKIINCISINASVAAFNIGGSYNLVENCEAYGEDPGGLKMDYYFTVVGSHNIFINNLSVKTLRDGKDWEHGFSLSGDKVGQTRYNLIEDQETTGGVRGIELRRLGCSNNVVRGAYSHDTELGLQIRDGANNNIIEKSIFKNVAKGIDFSATSEIGNGSAYNNIFRNVVILNARKVLFHRGRSSSDRPEVKGNKFYNLTIVKSGTLWTNYEVKPKTSSNEWVNCNIIDVSSQGFNSGQSFSNSNFHGSFQTQVGKSSNISKDPGFVDKKKGDFKLKSSSKSINKGKKLKLVSIDFDGNIRPQGSSHDIGAFEFGQKTVATIEADAGEDVSICSGEKVTLTASGGKKYKWSNGKTTPTITISPSKTITLSVKVSDGSLSDTAEVTVTVNEAQANAGKDVSINLGEEVTLTATGGDEYLWNTGETTASITVSPSETKGYKVTVKSGDCEDSDRVKVTVSEAAPAVIATVSDDISICKGEELVLSASGGSSYSWSNGSSSSEITISPDKTTSYTVTVSDGVTSDDAEVTVTVNEAQANAGKDVTIEEGEEVTLTATGGDEYLWSTGETTSSITVSPSETKGYKVTVKSGGCEDSDRVKVTVSEAAPAVIATVSDDISICKGEELVLSASGGSSYSWSTGSTASEITISPEKTTTYTVTVSDGVTSDDAEVTVTVNEAQANAGKDVTIEEGEEVTLTATGGDEYLWSTGETTSSITVSPSETKGYKVTVKSGGCEDSDRVKVTVSEAAPAVIATVSDDISICKGEELVLSASGGGSYSWSTGSTASEITISPEKTTTYTVTVSDGVTSDDAEVTVTVNEAQANAGKDVSINLGEEVTLTATGGDEYLWNTGETTASITVSPTESKSYEVTVKAEGCSDTDKVKVQVRADNIAPAVIATVSDDISICKGEELVLSASGGSSYSWSNGSSSSEITISPDKTASYTVTVSDGVTSDEATVKVTVTEVNANAGKDVSINLGEEVTLTATGGDEYLWNTGETTASITVSPTESKSYEVTVKAGGCSDTDKVKVQVRADNIAPAVIATVSDDISICKGEELVLSASGGSSYSWSNGSSSSEITISPDKTTSYTVTVSDGVTSDDAEVTVTVNEAQANAGKDVTIEEGEEVTLTATGGDEYLWSTGETTSSITVSPSETKGYDVIVTTGACQKVDDIRVTVKAAEKFEIDASAGEDVSICSGESITLTATGGTYFKWSNGKVNKSITVKPVQTTTYEVEVSDGVNKGKADVTVNVQNIEAEIGNNVTIDTGDSITLTASGGDTFEWSNGAKTRSITVSPNKTTIFTVTAYKNGCQDSSSIQVSVKNKEYEDLMPALADAGEDITICLGEKTTLNAQGNGLFKWSTGDERKSVDVSPKRTTKYVLEATVNGVTVHDEIVVFVENCSKKEADSNLALNMAVYPNPSEGLLNMNITGVERDLNLVIIDLNGRIIHSEKLSYNYQNVKKQLNLTRLPKGIYLVQVSNGIQSKVSKVLFK